MNITMLTAQQIISTVGVTATMPYGGIKLLEMNIRGMSRIPFLRSARRNESPPCPTAWKN